MRISSGSRMRVCSILAGLLNVGCSTAPTARSSGSGGSKQITVPGNQAWTPTGIVVKKGAPIRIAASGAISNNPSDAVKDETRPWDPLSDANDPSLIGRIGDSQFPVGSEKELPAPAAGEIFLGVNDNNVSDNGGEWHASVTCLKRWGG